jgi:hypothetical protein
MKPATNRKGDKQSNVLAPVLPIVFVERIFNRDNGKISGETLVQIAQLLTRNDISVVLILMERGTCEYLAVRNAKWNRFIWYDVP